MQVLPPHRALNSNGASRAVGITSGASPPRRCVGQGRLTDCVAARRGAAELQDAAEGEGRLRCAARAVGSARLRSAQRSAAEGGVPVEHCASRRRRRALGEGGRGWSTGRTAATSAQDSLARPVARQVQSGAVEWADVRHRRALKAPPHCAVAVSLQTAMLHGACCRLYVACCSFARRCAVRCVVCCMPCRCSVLKDPKAKSAFWSGERELEASPIRPLPAPSFASASALLSHNRHRHARLVLCR